jgi:hypothetical protein
MFSLASCVGTTTAVKIIGKLIEHETGLALQHSAGDWATSCSCLLGTLFSMEKKDSEEEPDN